MDKIEEIQNAINEGIARRSKLSSHALMVPSFTSINNRHILNNLGAISERYCEVGLHKGGTFVSTCFHNNIYALGVDDWSEFNNGGDTKEICMANARSLLENNFEVLDRDFFLMTKEELPGSFDLYFYDGSHNYESQKKALTHFVDSLSNLATIIVDDWDWKTVKDGTRDGLAESGLRIIKEWELTTNIESDNEGFWNGLYIALVAKKKA